jgi:hypothetical protein
MPQNRLACPFSAERLHDLYWREQCTPVEIAQLAQQAAEWQSPPATSTVRQWLLRAGIKLRTQSEAMRLAAKRNPAAFRARAARAADIHARLARWGQCYTGDASQMRTAAAKRKMKAAHAARAMPLETRPCDLCGQPITKKPHRFQGEFTFCSVACRLRALALAKRASRVECRCGYCGVEMSLPPSRLKGRAVVYCSRACSNRATKQKGSKK